MPGLSTLTVRRALTAVLLAAATVGAAAPAAAAPRAIPAPGSDTEPKAAIVVDVDRGVVLSATNEHEPMLTASTVKLMTALTALERLPMDSALTVSARTAATPANKINMKEGEVWPLAQALQALLIISANDAAYTLAEGAAGSIEAFAGAMQGTGERLGLQDSMFNDPAGLDDEEFGYNGGSRMSAYDLAIVARNALAVPAIAEAAATEVAELTDPTGLERTLRTRNDVFLGLYEGATGLKTGYTDAAGPTLVASATRDGRTLVAVVLGTPENNAWAAKLLDEGFAMPPDAPGTGATLPPVRAITYDTTAAAVGDVARGIGGSDRSTAATGASPQPSAPDVPVAASTSGGARRNWWLVLGGAALGLAIVALLLRRRAVMRRRRRRLVRQRALADARRRGMIDIIEPETATAGHVHVLRAASRRSSRANASRGGMRTPQR